MGINRWGNFDVLQKWMKSLIVGSESNADVSAQRLNTDPVPVTQKTES